MQRTRKGTLKFKSASATITETSTSVQFMDRRILTGLIVSKDYITQIRGHWNPMIINDSTIRMLSGWCIDYYDKYKDAPGKDIENIFEEKTAKLKNEVVKDIENILDSLSHEFTRQGKFNTQYLVDQTEKYVQEKNIDDLVSQIKTELDKDNLSGAKELIFTFNDVGYTKANVIDFASNEALNALERSFKNSAQSVVSYPRQLGNFWNHELIRGGFVALMGPEKRGKTFMLIDMARRAASQGFNVAVFQAGDMTDDQYIKRNAIHLTKKSDKEKFTGIMYEPVRDCIFNQIDRCDREERENDCGIFPEAGNIQEAFKLREFLRSKTYEELLKKKRLPENKYYHPCSNCQKYWREKWGATWLKRVNVKNALEYEEAKEAWEKFFIKYNRRYKLATYPNSTLTVSQIKADLDLWERQDGFVADLIIIDYVDIMASEFKGEVRHQEDYKWRGLRGLSQERYALVVTVTQADANSYTADTITMKNFTEDKRKFGHVTAMYGLNQDHKGLEKTLGIMRINKIVLREDESSYNDQVYVLQNLKRGQPCLQSFF